MEKPPRVLEPYFYQVKAPYVIIPETMQVYMTHAQMCSRSRIVPDHPQPSEGWYPVTEHSNGYTDLIFDRGDVFGLSQIPDPALFAQLQPWQAPSETPRNKPQHPKNTLCRFAELAYQPDDVFRSMVGLTRAEFTQRITALQARQNRRGRRVGFALQDGLYLWCLQQQGQYTYAQLAQGYHCSITPVYAAVQWVNKQLHHGHG